MNRQTYRINPGDPEAAGLVACYVTVPGGMMDLVTGAIGTRVGTADPTRPSEVRTLDAYFDGTGDSYTFGSTPLVSASAPFAVVWESMLDSYVDQAPYIVTLARGVATSPIRILLSNDATADDYGIAHSAAWGAGFLLPNGIAKTGQRHWGVWSFNGGTWNTASNHSLWVNGIAATPTTMTAGLSTPTDENRIGGSSNTTNDWNGAIRQVRVYDREWSEAEAVRFYNPPTRDTLFSRPRRKIYGFAAATGSVSAEAAITEAGDTLSSAAAVDVAATGAITEAGDTLSSAATVDVAATGAITEAGDVLSGEGVVGTAPIEATAAITEAGDTLSSAATAGVAATGAITEAGDTLSSAATASVAATGAITEAGDILSSEATVASTSPINASATITESGDTLSAVGSTGLFIEGNTFVFYVRARAVVWAPRAKPTTWAARRSA